MDQKILLIDDSAILRRIATNVLTGHAGCGEVATATRATEGFARACAPGVGLILVDAGIAGQSGAQFCRRLLDESRTKHIPVVLLLGRGAPPPPRGSLPSNVVETLVKPFTPEQLVSTVKAVFEHSGPVAQTRRVPERNIVPPVASSTSAEDYRPVASLLPVEGPANGGEPVSPARAVFRTMTRQVTRKDGTRAPSTFEPARLRAALHDAAAQRQTGVIRIRSGRGEPTEIYVEDGRVVVVSTRDAERYGEDAAGVMSAKVDARMLADAVADQLQSGVPFLITLGSQGLLSKTTAVTLLHRFGQKHFARLWTAPPNSLSHEFTALEALPGFALRLEARRESVDEWLLETLRYVQPDDLDTTPKRGGHAGTPCFRRGGSGAFQALRLNEQELEFGKLVEARRDMVAIAKALAVTAEHAFLLLFRFRCLEIMDYRSATSSFVVTPRTSVRRVLPLPG